MHKIFIIIPKINNDGPIKGAFALANYLHKRKIDLSILVSNGAKTQSIYLDRSIEVINLSEKTKNLFTKIINFRKILKKKFNRYPNIKISTISFCLEADLINSFAINNVNNICSMRANIFENYKYSFGKIGFLLGLMHYFFLRKFKAIIAMHSEMAVQIGKYYTGKVATINNFIDEDYFKTFTYNKIKNLQKNIVFVGSLSERKNPMAVIDCFSEIFTENNNIKLDIVGDGPLKKKLYRRVEYLNLSANVNFHGHLDNPYKIIQDADIMILPSYSEGMSRAILEALFFGVVCIIREIDGVKTISNNNKNIFLFNDSMQLSKLTKDALSRVNDKLFYKNVFLPKEFRQEHCINKFMDLIDE